MLSQQHYTRRKQHQRSNTMEVFLSMRVTRLPQLPKDHIARVPLAMIGQAQLRPDTRIFRLVMAQRKPFSEVQNQSEGS